MTTDSARQYARTRYRLLVIDLVASLLFLGLIQASGWSHALARWWARWVTSEPLIIAGYLTVLGGASYALTWPLHFYSSFLLEHRFGLSRLTLRGWWVRELKRLGLSALVGLLLIEGFYALLRSAPTTWPLWATIGWVGFSVVLARSVPTVVLPLFYKTSPVHDPQLVRRLAALCERVGLSALGVFRVDLGVETRKANAALAGLGRTRRILLSDTLLSAFPPEEIEGVLAHELAHHRYRHLTKLLLLSACGSWGAFLLTAVVSRWWVAALGLNGLSDIAGFPMVSLWLSGLGLVGLPLQNGLSRYFEWQADRFAVEVTGRPAAFASALRRLGSLNLADPNPPRWVEWYLYDHPSLPRRIAAAEAGS
ncbi:MAG: M48 family metallopeptidase [Candidatus Omnitrophota bacterium]|nr:M48 family metallopeptidase [Candidatus Omnitrophota bacterium]